MKPTLNNSTDSGSSKVIPTKTTGGEVFPYQVVPQILTASTSPTDVMRSVEPSPKITIKVAVRPNSTDSSSKASEM